MKVKPEIKRSQRGADKVARIPIKVIPTTGALPKKPPWLKARAPTDPKVLNLKKSVHLNLQFLLNRMLKLFFHTNV